MQTLIRAAALMAGALISSAAHAQCWGAMNAATSVISTVNTAFLPSGSAFLSAPNSAPDQQGGGVWTRSVGGSVNTEATGNLTGSFTITPPPAAGPSFSVPLNISCRSTVTQDYAGFEAGHDIAVLNPSNSGASWHFGVLAGYVGVFANGVTPNNLNGSQSGTIDAPSAGLYTAYSKGNFFADVQARLYNIQGESVGQRQDSRGYSIAGNTGYRFDLGNNWTLEPSAGGVFSRTSVDQIYIANAVNTLGVPIPGLPAATATASATQLTNDVESALGRASVKLGTSLPLYGGQIIAYPFVTASVFHEFASDATASIAVTGTFPSPVGAFQFRGNGNLTLSGVGTYGQFGAGSAFQLTDTGWLGYLRVDYRTGDNIQGYSVNAGLRYQLNPGTATVKDGGSLKDGPAEGYDWSGPYAGVSAGSTWGRTHWADQGDPADPDYAGYLIGGQAGYNFQSGRFVWGVEGDAGYSNAQGGKACPSQPDLYYCEDYAGTLGSLTARLGYTWGRALLYAKGGWAFGEVTAGTHLNFMATPLPGGMQVAHSTNWESGWTLGGGIEFALTNRWSAKAEYMHYEFPQDTFTVAQNVTSNATTSGDTVRIGLNYHFGPR
jgi:opacity protein-like surface antigen